MSQLSSSVSGYCRLCVLYHVICILILRFLSSLPSSFLSLSDYNGWPDREKLPVDYLTEEHRQIIVEKCSDPEKNAIPIMLDLPLAPGLLSTSDKMKSKGCAAIDKTTSMKSVADGKKMKKTISPKTTSTDVVLAEETAVAALVAVAEQPRRSGRAAAKKKCCCHVGRGGNRCSC